MLPIRVYAPAATGKAAPARAARRPPRCNVERARRERQIWRVEPHERHAAVNQSRTFAVVLEPEEQGGFTVRVPSLPEIVTYGKDEHEALAMAEDAIRLVLKDCAARGEPLPNGEPPRIREVTVTLAA
jgi:antitoxin HicB